MELSPTTLARLAEAEKASSLYIPSQATAEATRQKNLVEFIGVAAGGKSTIMGEAELLDPDFSFVTGFTSREEESRDVPGRYAYWNSDTQVNQLIDRIEARLAVQYVVHPTTKKLYGSFPEDYHTTYSMLDTLYNGVADLDKLPFKNIFKFAVVSKGDEWIQRFLERYPTVTEERTKRINEALLCLEWMQDQPVGDLLWLENRHNRQTEVAQTAIKLVRDNGKSKDLSFLAEEMYYEALKIAA